jgi:hypothetical protein
MEYNELHIVISLLDPRNPKELNFIKKLGSSLHVPNPTIDILIEKSRHSKNNDIRDDESKINFLIHLVRFLKSQLNVDREDIKICQKIAKNLGYEDGVISELFLHIYSDPNNQPDMETIKFKISQYLIS